MFTDLIIPAISSSISYCIGRLYLWIRYRDADARKQVLQDEYEGSYSLAGADKTYSFFGILFIVLLGVFMIVIIWMVIKAALYPNQ